ncbi:hypothetical protein RND81_09G099300 [Saponaria officinalis]|uniref:Uncharacterized protein n=1 Tax=Saponaria officinalis TaxID=3572 RepID=A0AAW1IIX1_SAPOF
MQTRVTNGDHGKDSITILPGRTTQSKPWSFRIVHFFLIFLVLGLGLCIISMNMIRYFGARNMLQRESSRYELCVEGRNTLESWIRPPCDLMHDMNDTELFWRASFGPRIKEYPYKRVTKVAFMFLTRGPLPLSPLWERFFKGNDGFYSIYVHSLPGYRANYSRSSVFYARQIPSQVTEWGKMSMCDAERRLLANALLDLSNEHFVLLSEACIPLRNFTIIYRYISKSRYSFMGSYDDRGPYGRGRYDKNMEPEVTLKQWRKGAQWFEVNRELALRIVEDNKYYPKFKQFCRPACYVDEHYFPTMLSIETPHLLANRSLTYTDWSRGGPHPATFGKDDVSKEFFDRIMGRRMCFYNHRLVYLCQLFARKFAPSALDPLLRLSSEVFGY